MKFKEKQWIWFACGFIVMLFEKCTVVPSPPPPATTCNFTIVEPNNYSCFVRHQAAGVPTTKIKLMINVITKYVNPQNTGADFITYDDVTLNFDPSTATFPITVTLKIPNKYVWYCDVNIQGTQCSECANGYSLPDEFPYGNCPSYAVTVSPLIFRAAYPRWSSSTNYYTSTPTIASPTAAERTYNVPNSCGCTVQ